MVLLYYLLGDFKKRLSQTIRHTYKHTGRKQFGFLPVCRSHWGSYYIYSCNTGLTLYALGFRPLGTFTARHYLEINIPISLYVKFVVKVLLYDVCVHNVNL